MTAANGYVIYNSSTGSDSNASGLGPASAVVGSSAELDGTSTVDMSYDGMDLSSISAGDLLFCETSSGRQFSVIASVDTGNETITTDDVWPTESGVSWAVGGKRATFEGSNSIAQETTKPSTSLNHAFEDDQTITTQIYKGGATFRSADPSNRITLTLANTGSYQFRGGGSSFFDMNLDTTTGTQFVRGDTSVQHASVAFYNCVVGDPVNQFVTSGSASSRTASITAFNTVFRNFSSSVFYGVHPNIHNCWFLDNNIVSQHGMGGTTNIYNSILKGNNWIANGRRASGCKLYGCTIIGKGTAASPAGSICTSEANYSARFYYCKFAQLSGGSSPWYGSTAPRQFYQCFGYNLTNGWVNSQPNVSQLDSPILTVDPFVDLANGDLRINDLVGGGNTIRNKTFQLTDAVGATNPYTQTGLEGSGNGSGSTFHPLAQ